MVAFLDTAKIKVKVGNGGDGMLPSPKICPQWRSWGGDGDVEVTLFRGRRRFTYLDGFPL